MKNLKETRKSIGLKLVDIEMQLGISHVNLSEYESGKRSPNELARRRLEWLFSSKTNQPVRGNWLDVPINTYPVSPPATLDSCEREFRYFIHQVASLPKDERKVFIETIIKHLSKL